MRSRLVLVLALSCSAFAQSPAEAGLAKGRYVRVLTPVWLPATRVRLDGKDVLLPRRSSSVEQWVWVAEGQPLPPNAARERARTDIDIPAVVVPDVVIP